MNNPIRPVEAEIRLVFPLNEMPSAIRNDLLRFYESVPRKNNWLNARSMQPDSLTWSRLSTESEYAELRKYLSRRVWFQFYKSKTDDEDNEHFVVDAGPMKYPLSSSIKEISIRRDTCKVAYLLKGIHEPKSSIDDPISIMSMNGEHMYLMVERYYDMIDQYSGKYDYWLDQSWGSVELRVGAVSKSIFRFSCDQFKEVRTTKYQYKRYYFGQITDVRTLMP